jgi:hypothetical protein
MEKKFVEGQKGDDITPFDGTGIKLASITRQIGNSKLSIEIFDDGTGTGKKKTKGD